MCIATGLMLSVAGIRSAIWVMVEAAFYKLKSRDEIIREGVGSDPYCYPFGVFNCENQSVSWYVMDKADKIQCCTK